MTIHIEQLTFDAIIGLLDFEREHTQRVVVDLEAEYDYENDAFIDYADLAETITARVKESRYELLEEALLDLETLVLSSYPHVRALYLKIKKPDILSNCQVALSQKWHY